MLYISQVTNNICFLKKGCGGLLGILLGFGGGGLFGLSLLMGDGKTNEIQNISK